MMTLHQSDGQVIASSLFYLSSKMNGNDRPSSHRRSFRPPSRPNTRPTTGQSRADSTRPNTDQTSRPWTAQTRPGTAQTRPGTARPTTAASTRQDAASYVIALLEGRGVAREVGIAALDRETGRVMLVQVSDIFQ